MDQGDGRRLLALRTILAAGILSTAIHYTHNFVAIGQYPGPHGAFDTITRVALVITWPTLTAIGLLGYRRYAQRRYREAHGCLLVYSVTGFASLGHFIYGSPDIPAFFYATIITDALTSIAVVAFVLWSAASGRRGYAAAAAG
jgi:hypothetical protein